jgi:hypothetical protein
MSYKAERSIFYFFNKSGDSLLRFALRRLPLGLSNTFEILQKLHVTLSFFNSKKLDKDETLLYFLSYVYDK